MDLDKIRKILEEADIDLKKFQETDSEDSEDAEDGPTIGEILADLNKTIQEILANTKPGEFEITMVPFTIYNVDEK